MVLPRLCRSAVETAARDAYFARSFGAGAERHAVESAWNKARTQPQRIGLALHRDAGRSPDGWLNGVPHRRPALAVCGKGNHDAVVRDPKGALRDVERLVADLRALPR